MWNNEPWKNLPPDWCDSLSLGKNHLVLLVAGHSQPASDTTDPWWWAILPLLNCPENAQSLVKFVNTILIRCLPTDCLHNPSFFSVNLVLLSDIVEPFLKWRELCWCKVFELKRFFLHLFAFFRLNFFLWEYKTAWEAEN
jgi:hypothetical protein